MNKPALREAYLKKRRALGPTAFAKACEAIAQLFVDNFPIQNLNCIHCFLPILKNQEINTWLIIEKIREINLEIKIAVSVSDFSNLEMKSYLLTPDTEIKENKWGIPEPQDALPLKDTEIDLVLLPLLAFDMQGHRVGYGKGFYDRFLSKCRKDLLTVGLSLEPAVVEIEGINEHDYKMDYAISPEKLWAFD